MPDFKISPEISWGSIMSTITILIGLAVGWTIMDERSKQTAASVKEFKDQLTAMDARFRQVEATTTQSAQIERAVSTLDTRVRSIETTAARDDQRLIAILNAVTRLEARFDRLEGRSSGP
jgi:hypothetical protein